MNDRTCAVPECDSPPFCRGWCRQHYDRWRRRGDVLAPVLRKPNVGACSVPGCDLPSRSNGMCGGHDSWYRKTGEARQWQTTWRREPGPCRICGEPTARWYCGGRCKAIAYRFKEAGIQPLACALCGCEIDLNLSGRVKRRFDLKLCDRCRQDSRKHKMSVLRLAQRDGAVCGICAQQVDMSLRYPELMRASVDHILPRARGGTNDPANLQLAHLWCNQVKQARVPSP